jgi:hypothetical protein
MGQMKSNNKISVIFVFSVNECVSSVETMLELNVIKLKKLKIEKNKLNVYFPLGAAEFFQTHPNVLE